MSSPHIVPINRSGYSPSAPLFRTKNLALSESSSPESRRKKLVLEDYLSVHDHSHTLMFQPLSPLSTGLNSLASSPAPESKNLEKSSRSQVDIEEEAVLGPYARLVRPPGGSGEDSGLNLNLLSPPSPVDLAVTSAGDDLAALPPLPDSPLSLPQHPCRPQSPQSSAVDPAVDDSREPPLILTPLSSSQFDFDNQESSDPLQSKRGPLISWAAAAQTMATKESASIGTIAIKGKETAGIKSYTPGQSPSSSKGARISTNAPENEVIGPENQPFHPHSTWSESSLPMVTAPDTPMFEQRSARSGISYDGMFSGMRVRNLATGPGERNASDDDRISPTGISSTSRNPFYALAETNSPISTLDGPSSISAALKTRIIDAYSLMRGPNTPMSIPAAPAAPIADKASGAPDAAGLCNSGGALLPQAVTEAPIADKAPGVSNAPDVPSMPNSEDLISFSEAPEAPAAQKALNTDNTANIPRSHIAQEVPGSPATIPGIPRDITGELPSPGPQLPKRAVAQLGKRRRMVKATQKLYRRVRAMVLGRRVLSVIIGRQLAGPTRDFLVRISKGLPVNMTAQEAPPPIPM